MNIIIKSIALGAILMLSLISSVYGQNKSDSVLLVANKSVKFVLDNIQYTEADSIRVGFISKIESDSFKLSIETLALMGESVKGFPKLIEGLKALKNKSRPQIVVGICHLPFANIRVNSIPIDSSSIEKFQLELVEVFLNKVKDNTQDVVIVPKPDSVAKGDWWNCIRLFQGLSIGLFVALIFLVILTVFLIKKMNSGKRHGENGIGTDEYDRMCRDMTELIRGFGELNSPKCISFLESYFDNKFESLTKVVESVNNETGFGDEPLNNVPEIQDQKVNVSFKQRCYVRLIGDNIFEECSLDEPMCCFVIEGSQSSGNISILKEKSGTIINSFDSFQNVIEIREGNQSNAKEIVTESSATIVKESKNWRIDGRIIASFK